MMPLIIRFTTGNTFMNSSYSEENFGGNQSVDGSIGISPLNAARTNKLYVSIATGLHQSFLWLHPGHA